MNQTYVLNLYNYHGPFNVIMFSIMKAARMWIGGDGILKARFPDGRKDTVEEKEKKKIVKKKIACQIIKCQS